MLEYALKRRGIVSNIIMVKQLIATQVEMGKPLNYGPRFEGVQKVYFSTNENIQGYINYARINPFTKCLSVLASGDHAFNLAAKGAKDIDTFDINTLTEYFVLGFKRALILKYNYYEYMEVCKLIKEGNLSLENTCDLINELLPYMDKKYYKFWQDIMNYNYRIQKDNEYTIDLFQMLCIGLAGRINHIQNNFYLNGEYEYNLLKKRIARANITFKKVNVTELSQVFNTNTYDVMMLSNILDYVNLDIKSFNELVKSLETMMNREGILFLKYIFMYGKITYRTHLFMEAADDLTSDKLTDFDIIRVPRTDKLKVDDGMILKRMK